MARPHFLRFRLAALAVAVLMAPASAGAQAQPASTCTTDQECVGLMKSTGYSCVNASCVMLSGPAQCGGTYGACPPGYTCTGAVYGVGMEVTEPGTCEPDSGGGCYVDSDCTVPNICIGANGATPGTCGLEGDTTVPEIPEILLPAFMAAAAGLAYRARKRSTAKRKKR